MLVIAAVTGESIRALTLNRTWRRSLPSRPPGPVLMAGSALHWLRRRRKAADLIAGHWRLLQLFASEAVSGAIWEPHLAFSSASCPQVHAFDCAETAVAGLAGCEHERGCPWSCRHLRERQWTSNRCLDGELLGLIG